MRDEPSWVPDETQEPSVIEENWLFRLRRERFRSRRSGKSHDYYVMHLADAVNVVAVTAERGVVLVRQFRAGAGRDVLETPGGLLDPGEDPLEAGARELREETGFVGDPPRVLGTVWSNPSILSSRITTLVIDNARLVARPSLDEGEEVRVEVVHALLIPRMLADGRIGHALAAHGLMWWLVSELPDTPLTLPPVSGRGPRQVRIATIMGSIAALSVVFAVIHAAGPALAVVVFLGVGIPVSALFVYRVLDCRTQATLLRPGLRSVRGHLFRGMACLGVLLVVGCSVGLLSLIVGMVLARL